MNDLKSVLCELCYLYGEEFQYVTTDRLQLKEQFDFCVENCFMEYMIEKSLVLDRVIWFKVTWFLHPVWNKNQFSEWARLTS